MKKAVDFLSNNVSPMVAKYFGLKPTFVTFLFMVLGGMCYLGYQGLQKFDEQNAILRSQMKSTNEILEALTDKVNSQEKRIIALETQLGVSNADMNSFKLKFTEVTSRIEAKMDIVSVEVRELNNLAIRKKL